MAHALVDGNAHGKGDTSRHNLAGFVLVLVNGVGSLLNKLITESGNVHNLGANDGLEIKKKTK